MSARLLENGVSVIVPVYNSEASLPVLVSRLEPVLRASVAGFELILVNDGSRDRSWEIVGEMVRRHGWIVGVNLMRNYGQHNALLCGIRLARFDLLVTIDDDLQHPPEEIPRLLQELSAGHDVVYGTPDRERHGFWRDIASRVTKLALQNAMGAETARRVSAFRALRTGLRSAFQAYQGPFVSIDVLLTWATTRFATVVVRHEARPLGSSNYTGRQLLTHALNMMTGFSTLPLQMASLIGFALTIFGLAVLVYIVIRYVIEGGSVPGFPFLASLVAIFSGAQMFALGIIGEYLARMHFRSMDRPAYAVREFCSGPAGATPDEVEQ
jgi:glycosyltransferase involved in cell wall biosynthesis